MKMKYRKPSLNNVLGVTKVKRRTKRNLGFYEITKYINAPKNAKARVKRKTVSYTHLTLPTKA